MLRLDGVAFASALLDLVEHAAQAQRLGGDVHATGAGRVPFFARPHREARIVDAAMVVQPRLDVLVRRHHAVDVLQVVQPRAVRDLVQGADRDQVRGIGGHGESL